MDVEAEDLDLGEQQADDLAFDVDADMADEDPDALDSDEDTEEHQLDKELGLDSDGVDGEFFFCETRGMRLSYEQLRCTLSLYILYCPAKNK